MDLKLKINKTKNVIVQKVKKLNFFQREGIKVKDNKIILYKKVSKDFKTQEGIANETIWNIGSIVECKDWSPKEEECGEGKFHAVSRPFFADELRDNQGDKYIAIEVKLKDLYEWKDNPQYPHKIGVRKAVVLYECGREGNKIIMQKGEKND